MKKHSDDIKDHVRQKYASIVSSDSLSGPASCCGDDQGFVNILEQGDRCGYTKNQLLDNLALANLGLGCGNPLDMANLKEGESVLDLGSGAGFDAFLAARNVGTDGRVIGVDMTFEMVEKARENAEKLGIENADFRVGEIEDLPVEDSSIDVVISNCVINLSPDKPAVYSEIYRVLKPGGRISISDVLRVGEIPEEVKNDIKSYTAWIAGAISPDEVRQILESAGFSDIVITRKDNSEEIIKSWNAGQGAEQLVISAYIHAVKP